ncbi:MAG: PD40 domain-containing protein [Bacteroidia bacterium]|nr:PD40 domain-containing protein [Bacteroidia bacterium]
MKNLIILLTLIALLGCAPKKILTITSEPSGSKVIIDGIEKGETPLSVTLKFPKSTVYKAEVKHDGYKDEIVMLEKNPIDKTVYNVKLQNLFKEVTITSEPSGSRVYIAGEDKGITPLTISLNMADVHLYKAVLKYEGYKDETIFIEKEPVDKTIYSAKLKGLFKKAIITSSPSGANIFINGIFKGVTPYTDSIGYSQQGNNAVYMVLKLNGFVDTSLYVDYKPSTKTQYHVQMEKVEVVNVKLITIESIATNEGVKLSKVERSAIAYLETIERSTNVKSVTKITDNQEKLTQIGAPVMCPTNNAIIYSIIEQDDKERTYSNIWLQTIGSFSKTKITSNQTLDLFPAFSADGKDIFFSSNRTSTNSSIWRVKQEGAGGITKITNTQQSEDYGVCTFPGGNHFAYTSNSPGANEPEIWTATVAGTLLTQLREGEFPQVSPDEKKILFTVTDKMHWVTRGTEPPFHPKQMWTMNIDGSGPTELSQNVLYNVIQAKWSPDGKWIVFASDEGKDSKGGNNYDIWIMKSDGTNKTQLTTNGSWDDNPCWSNNGKSIYFRSNRGGNWNIWRFEPILD